MELHPQPRFQQLARAQPAPVQFVRIQFQISEHFLPAVLVVERPLTGRHPGMLQQFKGKYGIAGGKAGMEGFGIAAGLQSQAR